MIAALILALALATGDWVVDDCVTPAQAVAETNKLFPGMLDINPADLGDVQSIDAAHPNAQGWRFRAEFKDNCLQQAVIYRSTDGMP